MNLIALPYWQIGKPDYDQKTLSLAEAARKLKQRHSAIIELAFQGELRLIAYVSNLGIRK